MDLLAPGLVDLQLFGAAGDGGIGGMQPVLALARLAHLATTYPAVHYAVLTAIAASIVLAYLVETDQEVLQFLSSLQLRLLFTILIGVFSGVGSVVTDIADPFRGAYRITSTVAQFFPLREALVADVACKRSALDAPPAE